MAVSEDSLKNQLSDIDLRAERLLDGLGPEQLAQRPDPAKWSIAECLAHLNLSARMVQPAIGKSIEWGTQRKITGQGPFVPGLIGAFFTWAAEPPPKFRLPAPNKLRPQIEPGGAARIVPEFWQIHWEWERLLRSAKGLDLARITTKPLARLPSIRLAGIFAWMFAHERRHLLQAEEVRHIVASVRC